MDYLAKIWIVLLLLLLLAWVAKIRSESEALPHFRAAGVFHCFCKIAVTLSSALKITSREPTVQRAPL